MILLCQLHLQSCICVRKCVFSSDAFIERWVAFSNDLNEIFYHVDLAIFIHTDIIVGAPYADPNDKEDAGKVYVYFGSCEQKFEVKRMISCVFDGYSGFVLYGWAPGDYAGWAVASWDMNDDSVDGMFYLFSITCNLFTVL